MINSKTKVDSRASDVYSPYLRYCSKTRAQLHKGVKKCVKGCTLSILNFILLNFKICHVFLCVRMLETHT